ncbi:cobyrinic acid a,c-diamide synthase [Aureimonas endophytica]|uniref:Cobyrinic acid a,c-diamide synthase n=1 Tax=Aureimonas endophytica TaxID=2027858 RepID=A0A916ZT69_9HYPH|nr:ParA family protein [Aureimonas endophytica]GGE12984.1 cobyrinic acid a,c-diamide synthase [Aureimonas endophytica]
MTRILAIANRKGGTGKTATTVNLAAEAAAAGLRTLVVDLDTQGHAGLGFDVAARRGEPTVHDLFRDPRAGLAGAIRATATERVFVAPADPLFDGTAAERSPTRLARELRGAGLARDFDLVLIDTPPAYDMLLVNALGAAEEVLVPTLPHALSADGVSQLARIVFLVAARVNAELRIAGLLPVMVGANPRHHKLVLDMLARDFGAERILPGIRSDIRVAEAFAARCPVRRHAPGGRASSDYRRLLAALLDRFSPKTGGSLAPTFG